MGKKQSAKSAPKGSKTIKVKIALEPNVLEFKRNKMIDVEREIDRLTEKKREVGAEWTAKLKDAREQRKALLEELESGRQEIEVDVVEKRDDRRGCMLIVRADNGVMVDERPMSEEEKQLDLEESIRQKAESDEADAKSNGQAKVKGRGKKSREENAEA